MGDITTSALVWTVEGNQRVTYGRAIMSTSYATSGEAYTTRNFGLGTIDELSFEPNAEGYFARWNTGATRIMVGRLGGPSIGANFVVDGPNTTAGAAMSVGWPGFHASSSGINVLGPQLCGFQSTAANTVNTLSTSDTTTQAVVLQATAGGLAVYASTSGVLFTTSTVGINRYVPLEDGSLLQVGIDTTASYRLLLNTAAANGIRIKTTLNVDINVPVSRAAAFGVNEVASAADLSAVIFRFKARGF